MTKNPAEIAGTRYKNEKLMSRVQKTDGTSRCFAQIENIKRQSLSYLNRGSSPAACTSAGMTTAASEDELKECRQYRQRELSGGQRLHVLRHRELPEQRNRSWKVRQLPPRQTENIPRRRGSD